MTLTPTPSYTPRQLEALVILQRIRMAWITFGVILIVFSTVFGIFLYLILWDKGTAVQQVSVFLLDGGVVWMMKSVVTYLFGSPKKD